MESDTYTIKTSGFEGPLGLLLHLVEKRKLFINDVSLAQVTDDYLNYVNKLGETHPGEVSSFIVVAATLILIKSRSLLPNLDLTSEEEGDIKNLEERLRLYELFSKLSGHVRSNFGKRIIFAPLERKSEVLVFLPDAQITKENMMGFARDTLGRMPQKVFLPEVEVKKVISITEMIDNLTQKIQNSLKVSFGDFAGKAVTREEKIFVIVGFLAMLELVRNGILHAVQEKNGDDIIISRRPGEVGTPTESVGGKNPL
ncbi:MAG: segregation/condensation protein A [Patescibacteria group bacterium]